ncbi:MAG: hypothetical protein K0Q46_2505 [Rhodococcus erythropolis]|jgi:hypothetical protein|nr:hypothetical protein [Rhodococcus erythropolis]MDF2895719.1 hypothetical protein [Rhodococcus erythropolis]
MTDLLDVVDVLTKPSTEHITQTADDGTYIGIHSVQHPSLLDQLYASITPSAGNDGGSKSVAARERNMVKSEALAEWGRISEAVRGWCCNWGANWAKDDVQGSLRRWYVTFNARCHEPADIGWYTTELRRWVRVIRTQLEPPKRLEIRTQCPVCRSEFWIDQNGEVFRWPIVVEYRKVDGQPIRPRATCRACPEIIGSATEWVGFEAVAELGDELTEKAEELTAT